MMATATRVRFAPSPSGALHPGSIRSALFNFLLARSRGGVFILRIDDSDKERSIENATASIMTTLTALGLTWDEGPDIGGAYGPYRQSERGAIYADALERLIRSEAVYRCFCSRETLAADRAEAAAKGRAPRYRGRCAKLSDAQIDTKLANGDRHLWRFRIGADRIEFEDGVRGPLVFDARDLDDFAITRADQSALYLFASAVDDASMSISDVARGEDHLSNTPRQIAIIRALGFEPPNYHHLPLALGADGRKKFSKRSGDRFDIAEAIESGYEPDAILSALANLGWSAIGTDSVSSLDEMIEIFDIGAVSKSPARFDRARLEFLNLSALRARSGGAFVEKIRREFHIDDEGKAARIGAAVAATISSTSEFIEYTRQFFERSQEHDEEILRDCAALEVVETFREALRESDEAESFDEILSRAKNRLDARGAKLFIPIRIALTGRKTGPALKDLFGIIGKKVVQTRIDRFLARS